MHGMCSDYSTRTFSVTRCSSPDACTYLHTISNGAVHAAMLLCCNAMPCVDEAVAGLLHLGNSYFVAYSHVIDIWMCLELSSWRPDAIKAQTCCLHRRG
jgi:hypothetical protein